MAQPTSIELLAPSDMTIESTRPEQMTSGVKLETTRILRTKTNVTDVAMQGRQTITFEYEGTYHNLRFYQAKVKFSVKLINAPIVPSSVELAIKCSKQMQRVTMSIPHMDPSCFQTGCLNFTAKKQPWNIGGTEIEPGTQTHQITKLVDFHTKMKPEEAVFKYSNLGGYQKEYDAKWHVKNIVYPFSLMQPMGP